MHLSSGFKSGTTYDNISKNDDDQTEWLCILKEKCLHDGESQDYDEVSY